jgi:hypothetical protein
VPYRDVDTFPVSLPSMILPVGSHQVVGYGNERTCCVIVPVQVLFEMPLKSGIAPDRVNLESDFRVQSSRTNTDVRDMFGLCATVTFDSPVFRRTRHP